MENQQRTQAEKPDAQVNERHALKRFPMRGVVFGFMATAAVMVYWMDYPATSTTRPSTPSEIKAQRQFQEELNTAQLVFQQKLDDATRKAAQTPDAAASITDRQMRFQEDLNGALKEFQQRMANTLNQ